MTKETKKQIEKIVVKLTRIAHPQDLGEPTSKLEDAIRTTLTKALEERVKEARQQALEERVKDRNEEYLRRLYSTLIEEFVETGLATEEQWNKSISPAMCQLANVIRGNEPNSPTARVYKYPITSN